MPVVDQQGASAQGTPGIFNGRTRLRHTYTHTHKALGFGGSKGTEKTKWPGKSLKHLFFLAPHFAQGSKRGPSREKSQAAGPTSCAAPEIGAELSGLGPSEEDSCSSLGPIPSGGCSDDGDKMFIQSH